MRNGTDGKHSFDNVCICLCWHMQSIFSKKEREGEQPCVSDRFTLRIIFGGYLTLVYDNMKQTFLNCPQMNCDGRHVLSKWFQLAWTEQANCCHLDRSLVVQLEKQGLRMHPLQNTAYECLCVHRRRSKFKFENVCPQLVHILISILILQ